ncbi:hypothetical protein IIM_04100 [Bacillus cereus VD107]|nr:hypothetical protein IIM_04100 [Bacillus cereus VD107]
MKLFYISIAITFYFFAYIVSEHSFAHTIHHKFPVVYFLILFVTIILVATKKMKISINKKQRFFLFIAFMVYVFFPIISFNIVNFDFTSNVNTVFFDFIFIIAIVIISSQMGDLVKFYRVMLVVAIGNGLYILPEIFLDFSQIFVVDNYTWILKDERTARATYGLGHPNFAGMIILVEIFSILFCLFWNRSIFIKIICIVLEVILIFALITTGNRAAVYALVFSIIVGVYLFLLKKINTLMRNILLVYSTVIFFIFIVFIFDWTSFYSSSASLIERFTIMNSVISYIPIYGDYLFGIAPLDQISLATEFIFLRNDNWFIQTVVLYGVLGLTCMLILILYLFCYEVKTYFKSKKNTSLFNLVVFIAVINYSMMEITLFAHGYSLSLFLWIIILTKNEYDKSS